MKQGLILPIFLLQYLICFTQYEHLSAFEQQIEFQADNDVPGDAYLDVLQYYTKHPLNLNKAKADDLKELLLLSDLQIEHLMRYRLLFGKLLNIYELQAVPLWNPNLIKQVLPYITVKDDTDVIKNFKQQADGTQRLSIRSSMVLEKARGFQRRADTVQSNHYLGSRNRLNVRYTFKYKNLLQWGLLADKDAGEQLFSGKQKSGFDFYSLHFFVRKTGIIKALALGDYAVNMGQGLIHWQSLAFKKNADITAVKRQSPVLRPYTSSGEFNFHRGAGITLERKKWELTGFLSNRKHSSNAATDSLSREEYVSSLISNGYHRTHNELADKKNIRQMTYGGCLKYSSGLLQVAMNTVNYTFSSPLQKQDQPYNLFAVKGSSMANYSLNYNYTYKNLHFFGEAALDKYGNKALLHGLMISPDQFINAAIVHRTIHKRYQSLYSNAFTENTMPVNEKGLYAGISVMPSPSIRIEAYMDVFHFPWLKYRVDAPSSGKEYFIQLNYIPAKNTEIYTRFKSELKPANRSGSDLTMRIVDPVLKQNWRIHVSLPLNRSIKIRNRCEVMWYDRYGPNREQGFLLYSDILYKPPLKSISATMRLLYFETEGYNSRMYAFENDVLSDYSVPAIFDKGFRYYINFKWDISAASKRINQATKVEVAAGFAQTLYKNKSSIGSGLDEINGNRKSELKVQLLISK